MSHRSIAASVLLTAVLLPLSACHKQAAGPLPSGIQTVSGTLQAAAPSLKRRGTFVLLSGNTPLYYVESATINLTPLEGRDVALQGTVEANTDPSAEPVLVVQRVVKGGDEPTKLWKILGLGLSLEVPQSWHASIKQDRGEFTLSGSTFPVLSIFRQSTTSLPFQFDSPPTGSSSTLRFTPLFTGGRHGLSVLDQQQAAYTVYVRPDRSADPILTLVFDLSQSETGREDIALFMKITHSLTFASGGAQGAQSASADAVSSEIGKPCGGPAGILCPQGLYCQITDTATNVGRCARF